MLSGSFRLPVAAASEPVRTGPLAFEAMTKNRFEKPLKTFSQQPVLGGTSQAPLHIAFYGGISDPQAGSPTPFRKRPKLT